MAIENEKASQEEDARVVQKFLALMQQALEHSYLTTRIPSTDGKGRSYQEIQRRES